MSLPEAFCWTKFGDESGEQVLSIFQRKEVERHRNGGVFLWGIGQSIRPSLLRLLRVTTTPDVLFSPIRSASSELDVSPKAVAVWCDALDLDGRPYRLPKYSLVTSRSEGKRACHFALVCASSVPVIPGECNHPRIALGELRNLASGSRLGSSQVTSVVRRVPCKEQPRIEYPIMVQARLVYPYLIRLTRQVMVPSALRLDTPGGVDLDTATEKLLRLRRQHAGDGICEQLGLPASPAM